MGGNGKHKRLLGWRITEWLMSGEGGWKVQPVILVEGQKPFFADHPEDYIKKLEAMHDDPALAKGSFYTFIGQLKDGLELHWRINREGRRSYAKNTSKSK